MDVNSGGVQLGTDLYRNRCFQFGAMFGYESHTASIVDDRTFVNDYYFGLYSQYLFCNGVDLRNTLGFGWQDYKSRRYDGIGRSYSSKYDGSTFETTIELGRRMYVNRCLSFRPVVGVDINVTSTDAHREGDLGNLSEHYSYGKATLTQAHLRFGSDVNWRANRWALNGGAYYAVNVGDDKTKIDVTSATGIVLPAYSTKLGRSTISLNAGTSYNLDQRGRYALFANYYGDIYADRDGSPMGHTGMVGLSGRF
jgi:hypothetical protein